MDPLIGKQIGHYVISEFLGEGGMAKVYKAHQPALDRHVAIKILTGPLASDEEFVARFRREAMAAGALGHPNILTIHDAGTTEDGLHYIIMEYAPGGTLKDLLDRGPLAPARAREIAAQIADALEMAHQRGIVHRDLKPSNILFARDGRPLLMDFGVALMSRGTRLTRTGMAVGTAEYMSPEQGQGLAVDNRSDIYSLGIVLYEMLTGDVPFVGDTPLGTLYQHVHNRVSTDHLVASGVAAWLTGVVQRALAKRPEERYAAARHMAAALRRERALEAPPARPTEIQAEVVTPPPVQMAPPGRARRSRPLVWGLLVVVGIAVVAAATYALFFRPRYGPGPGGGTAQPVVIGQPTEVNPALATAVAQAALEETVTARAQETAAAEAVLEETVTARALETATAVAALTAQARAVEAEQAAAESTRAAQERMATDAAVRVATVQASETQVAVAGAESTRAAQAAEATSAARATEERSAVERSLTAEAQATGTAQAQATQTAEALPTRTPTSPPPTDTPVPPTATPVPPTATPVPPTDTPVPPPPPARSEDITGFETEEAWRRGDEPYGTLTRSTEQVHEGGFSGKLAYDFPTNGNDYVVFLRTLPLGGEPDVLSGWVYGDGSGHFLNAWIRDAQGQVWQTTFGQVTHVGWAPMIASLLPGQDWPYGHVSGPDNGRVDYPIDFRAVVLDDVPDGYSGTGAIFLDELASQGGAAVPPGETPAVPTATPLPVASAPLGGRIAFPVFNAHRGGYDIFVAKTDGSDRRLVVQEARQPAFRPDGRLVVNGDGGGRDNLWGMNADGSDAHAVSRHPEDAHPSWSGDGGRLAFDSLLGPDKSAPRLYVHDDLSARNEPRMVMFGSYEVRGQVSVWLADGRIVFNGCNYWDTGGDCGLWAVWDSGGEPARLTSSPNDTAAAARGDQLAFMSRRDGNWEVYGMNWDGGGQRNLSQSPANDGLPAWSPDGQWIAFVSDRSGQWAVWAMRPDGSEPRQLFPLEGGSGSGDYDWSTERISWGP